MLPLPMIRHRDQIFYLQYSRKSSYEVMSLKKDNQNIESTIQSAYSMNDRIL